MEEVRVPRLESAKNTTDQSALRGMSNDRQYGYAHLPLTTADSYINGLFNQLARRQNEIPRDLATRQTHLSNNNTRQSAQWGTYTPDQRYRHFLKSTKCVALTLRWQLYAICNNIEKIQSHII